MRTLEDCVQLLVSVSEAYAKGTEPPGIGEPYFVRALIDEPSVISGRIGGIGVEFRGMNGVERYATLIRRGGSKEEIALAFDRLAAAIRREPGVPGEQILSGREVNRDQYLPDGSPLSPTQQPQ